MVLFYFACAEDDILCLSQGLLNFAEVEYLVVCFDLKVYGDGDGAFEFTGLGPQLLVSVVILLSFSHSGMHEIIRCFGGRI